MSAALNISTVFQFISTCEDEAGLEKIKHACTMRAKALFIPPTYGDRVQVQNISPACFRGMTGEIVAFSRNGNRADIKVSTREALLRLNGNSRLGQNEITRIEREIEANGVTQPETTVFKGFPVSCLRKIENQDKAA